MPLPMMVLQMMAVGLPLLLFLPSSMAAWIALRSWPSVRVITSQPYASKRLARSPDWVNSAMRMKVTQYLKSPKAAGSGPSRSELTGIFHPPATP